MECKATEGKLNFFSIMFKIWQFLQNKRRFPVTPLTPGEVNGLEQNLSHSRYTAPWIWGTSWVLFHVGTHSHVDVGLVLERQRILVRTLGEPRFFEEHLGISHFTWDSHIWA